MAIISTHVSICTSMYVWTHEPPQQWVIWMCEVFIWFPPPQKKKVLCLALHGWLIFPSWPPFVWHWPLHTPPPYTPSNSCQSSASFPPVHTAINAKAWRGPPWGLEVIPGFFFFSGGQGLKWQARWDLEGGGGVKMGVGWSAETWLIPTVWQTLSRWSFLSSTKPLLVKSAPFRGPNHHTGISQINTTQQMGVKQSTEALPEVLLLHLHWVQT